MNRRASILARARRSIAARFARPQRLWLDADGVRALADPPAAVQPFADWCAGHPGAAVELVVSTRLLHELVCEPGLPIEDATALQAYARQLFGHYFGAAAQRWAIAGWQAGDRRGASALHGIDWAALRATAAAHDVALRGALPAWVPALQRAAAESAELLRASSAALAVVEGQVLTWIELSEDRIAALRQVRIAADGLDATLAELCGGREIRVERADALAASASDVATAAGALPTPDFVAPLVRRSRFAWPLAVTGLLVLATAGAELLERHRARVDAEDRVARLERSLRRQPAAAPKPATGGATAAAANEQQRLRALGEVQSLLRQPWEARLVQVEQVGAAAPAGQLGWLALDIAAGRHELRLEGIAQDKLVALKLADELAAAPGWRHVVLSRFQAGEQGLAGQRFELSAKLGPAAELPR